MKINIDELKEVTFAARQKQEDIVIATMMAAADRKKAHQAVFEAKANYIVSQINGRAMKEAKAGRCHAIVMGLKWRDSDWHGVGEQGVTPEILKDVAKLVWNACVTGGLKPTLEYWHDGMGINSGYNIVVHW